MTMTTLKKKEHEAMKNDWEVREDFQKRGHLN